MYCSSCGTGLPSNLSYCNRCGAELKSKEGIPAKLSETSLQSLVWATASVTIVGLGVVIGLMAVMKEVLHFNDGLIIAFTLLSFLTFLGVDCVFIWVLLRSWKDDRAAYGITQVKGVTRRELGEAREQVFVEPAVSVTEHTTHSLEAEERQSMRERRAGVQDAGRA